MDEATLKKQLDFYSKAKKQYESSAKPVIYEFHLSSSQPKPRKFQLMITKFVDIFKSGMKENYASEDETTNNYWNQLQKNLSNMPQIAFIIKNVYDTKNKKLRIFFALLLHNNTLFSTIESIIKQMPYLYVDPQEKIKGLKKEFELVAFLENADIRILSDFITDFDAYVIKCKEEELFKKKEQERRKQAEIEAEESRQRKIKLDEENRLKKISEEQQRIKNLTQNNGSKPINTNTAAYAPIVESRPQIVTPTTIPVAPQVIQIRNETQYIKHRSTHQKASQILFNQHYKDELEVFSFKLKPEISKDKSVCFQCKKPLSEGLYFFGGNSNFCNYTGQWYCNNDISQERIAIPWKALQNFDLRGYQVSKESLVQIRSLYEKPIIQIPSNHEVLKRSQKLYQFLVLQRQIHLMYDSICNSQFMEKLLQKRLNYCLKKHLFSLKNLYDIYNGLEGPSLQGEYDLICKHFYKCEICQKKKGYICAKCNCVPKIFPFELRSTFACKICRKMYHRTCLQNNRCDCTPE